MLRSSVIYRRLWYARRRNAARTGLLLKVVCLAAVIALLGTYLNGIIFPILLDVSEARAREMVSETVEAVLYSNLRGEEDYAGYVSVNRDSKGNVSSVQVDYAGLNSLAQEISKGIQKRLELLQQKEVVIPAGVLLGDTIFSSSGPGITVKIIPVGSVGTEFRSQFLHAGINQTKHSINLRVKVTVGIMAPLAQKKAEIETDIPVAETVIVGEVPESYTGSNEE